MPAVSVSRVIQAEVPQIWALLSDMSLIYRFNPYVESSPLIGEQSSGIDAQRTCHFYDGGHVVERVSAYEAERKLEVEILEGSMPLKQARVSFDLEPAPNGSTKISMSMNYEVKYGPLGWVMNAFMIRRMMKKMITRVLTGLDEHARTGELIGRDGQASALQTAAA